MSDFYRLLVD